MDLQADIKWIQNELNKVKDPDLIEIFKRLLQMKKSNSPISTEEYNLEISQFEKDILDERLQFHKQNPSDGKSWEEIKTSLSQQYGL